MEELGYQLNFLSPVQSQIQETSPDQHSFGGGINVYVSDQQQDSKPSMLAQKMDLMNFNPFAVASKPDAYDINWAYERYEEMMEEEAIRQRKQLNPVKLLTDKRYADAGDDSFF